MNHKHLWIVTTCNKRYHIIYNTNGRTTLGMENIKRYVLKLKLLSDAARLYNYNYFSLEVHTYTHFTISKIIINTYVYTFFKQQKVSFWHIINYNYKYYS